MLSGFKKRKSEEEPGDWALTFADMMTLLLCFFILIMSIAEINPEKYNAISENLSKAMGVDKPKQQPSQVKRKVDRLQAELLDLRMELGRSVGKDNDAVDLQLRPDAVAVVLKGAVFFRSGQARLTRKARRLLDDVARPLVKAGYPMTIEGHTDDIPIHTARFPSNWELSAARAAAVARFLEDEGYPHGKIKVSGLADTEPVVPNRDAKGRPIPKNQARNRRITILVHPKITDLPQGESFSLN
jgi:chemotaxis protein MotB